MTSVMPGVTMRTKDDPVVVKHEWVDMERSSYYVRKTYTDELKEEVVGQVLDMGLGRWVASVREAGAVDPQEFYHRKDAKDWITATIKLDEVANG